MVYTKSIMNPNAKALLIFSSGVIALLILLAANNLATLAFAEQRKISCHTPKPAAATEYCVYHTTRPGLFAHSYRLIIGNAPNRGLFYDIPYASGDVGVDWSEAADRLTIAMPGTKLTIEANEYIDSR